MGDLERVEKVICDEKMKRLEDRIDKMEGIIESIQKLTLSVERLTITVENMVREQEAQKNRIDAIERIDGERWRTFIKYVATAIVSAIVGYAMTNIGF